METFVFKLGENVCTLFIFSLAHFGRSSLNAYVVITRLLCDFSSMMFLGIKLNNFLKLRIHINAYVVITRLLCDFSNMMFLGIKLNNF